MGNAPTAEIYLLLTDWREQTCSRHLLYRSKMLWRVAVHGLQPAVRVGKDRRHIHFAADDLDICPGFVGTRGLHRLVEFTEGGHPRRVPIRASERLRQFGVVPGRKIVVSPVRVFFQRPLNEIAAIVEDEDNDVGAESRPMAPMSFAVS